MKYYWYAILGSVLLSTIAIFVKLIGESVPIMTLSFFRVFFAFLVLLAIVPFIDTKWKKIKKNHLKMYALIGLLFAVTISLYNAANLFAPVQNVVLINSAAPVFVLIFAYFLLKEKITKVKIVTLGIAFVGLVIINPFHPGAALWGNIMALLASICYALLISLMRKEEKCQTIGAVIWFFLFATIFMLPFPFIFGIGTAGKIQWLYLLLLGALSTGAAYLFINIALKKIEAENVSIISTLVIPIVAIVLAGILFKEVLSVRIILGGFLLVSAGIYMQVHTKNLK
jgi:drug/metabolite transporter (DMT)-like permease